MIEAKKKLAAATNERDRDFWTNKCEIQESTINTAVYKLYGLTNDEIALIESGSEYFVQHRPRQTSTIMERLI